MSTTTLTQVMERVAKDAIGKSDYTTEVANLHMTDEGKIAFRKTSLVDGPKTRDIDFSMTDWATGQAFSKLNMPVQYFKKTLEADPKMVAQHFNYWNQKSNGTVMLRSRVLDGAGLIRGLVSDKYSVLDNDSSMDTLQALMAGNDERFKIRDFFMDDKRMHMRVSYTDMTKSVGTLKDGTPDYLQLGMDVVNSEVGASSFGIVSMIYRLVCTNGLRRWDKNGDEFSQRHVSLKPIEFRGRVAEAMVTSIGTGAQFLEAFQKTQEMAIKNPFDVIDNLAARGDFTKEFTDTAKQEYEGGKNAYGIVNAITAASRNLGNERRLETEKFAGKLVNLKPADWVRLDRIKEFTEDSNNARNALFEGDEI